MSMRAIPPPPYKGLTPYAEEDAPFFFGREPERQIITSNLNASRLTLLYGPSGVGKSSVLRAGVAHQLRLLSRRNLDKRGYPGHAVIVFSSWRDDPLAGLTRQIHDSVAQAMNQSTILADSEGGLTFSELLASAAARVEGRMLIILDQFEEYFLYHGQEDGDGTLAVELPRAINDRELRAGFLISIREDALAMLDRFEGRVSNLFNNILRVEHLSLDSARDAVDGPIAEYNRRLSEAGDSVIVEPELCEAVLDQVRTGEVVIGEAGLGAIERLHKKSEIETPFLQLVMTRLWNEEMREGSRVLRLKTLERLGGAENIVRTHLDESLSGLSSEEQDISARVFRYLVTPGGAKIAYSAADLEYMSDEDLTREQIASVLDGLSGGDTRLLRPVAPPPDHRGELRYEIFHDVLAPAVLDWRARYVQRQQQAKTERELASERKRVSRQRMVLIAMAALLIAVIALAVGSLWLRAQAEDQRKTAQARRLAITALSLLETDPALARLIAAEAVGVKKPVDRDVEDAFRKTLQSDLIGVMQGHGSRINQASFSPDGSGIVTVSDDGTARVWDAKTCNTIALLRHGQGRVVRGSFSSDGEYVVTAGVYWAKVWTRTGSLVNILDSDGQAIDAQFSPDGGLVAVSGFNSVQIWDVWKRRIIREFRSRSLGPLIGASFSRDGKYLLTSTIGGSEVWDIESEKRVAAVNSDALTFGTPGLRAQGKFDPSGKYIVTVDGKTARICETQTGRPVVNLSEHTEALTTVSFSPDGAYLLTASLDATARVWNVTNWKSVVLRGHKGPVQAASFSLDGRFVVTASDDGIVRVWQAATGGNVAEPRRYGAEVNSVEFSPDGQHILTAESDGTARLWEARPLRLLNALPQNFGLERAVLNADGTRVVTIAEWIAVWHVQTATEIPDYKGRDGWLSLDGRFVLVSRPSATLEVLDLFTGKILLTIMTEISPHTAALSLDGRYVAAVKSEEVIVWETDTATATAREVARLKDTDISRISFSPDGRLLATASHAKTARVWQVATENVVAELDGLESRVTSVSFSPDGQLVLIASVDKTARIWEARTGKLRAKLVSVPAGSVSGSSFSPDGRSVITASLDRMARIWDVRTGKLVNELKGHSGPVSSASFGPDGAYAVTASQDGTARVWELKTGRCVVELRGHGGPVNDASFSPDGSRIVTCSDGIARIFACDLGVDLEKLVEMARERAGRELTDEERRQYLPAR